MEIISYDKSKIEKTVDLLLSEGFLINCDETTVNREKVDKLPIWYDEKKYLRGQLFFKKYMFGMFFGKICGLLTILLIPTILNILKFTNMSGTSLKAYKRYMATIFHMTLWYDNDFRPGSELWQSIKTVRNLHFSASCRAANNKMNRISQADMVLTQFGLMGYTIAKPEAMGIHNASEEDFQGLVHLWRVIGYLLGIEDRFNLCRESVEETKQYCNLLIEREFAKRLQNTSSDFKQMSKALIDGLWCFQPCLNYPVFLAIVHKLCNVPFETFYKFGIKDGYLPPVLKTENQLNVTKGKTNIYYYFCFCCILFIIIRIFI